MHSPREYQSLRIPLSAFLTYDPIVQELELFQDKDLRASRTSYVSRNCSKSIFQVPPAFSQLCRHRSLHGLCISHPQYPVIPRGTFAELQAIAAQTFCIALIWRAIRGLCQPCVFIRTDALRPFCCAAQGTRLMRFQTAGALSSHVHRLCSFPFHA